MIPKYDMDRMRKIVLDTHIEKYVDIKYIIVDNEEEVDYPLYQRIPGVYNVVNGMTKVVLSFAAMPDYVVKIPIWSNEEVYWNNFEEESAYDGAWKSLEETRGTEVWPAIWNLIYRKSNSVDKWNYCAAEAVYTKLAEDCGLGDCILGTYYLCDVDGVPVYISPAAQSEFDVDGDSSLGYDNQEFNNSRDKAVKILSSKKSFAVDEDLAAYLILSYGPQVFSRLLNFIQTYHVTDLHSGNFMVGQDNKLKMIDLCGYNY